KTPAASSDNRTYDSRASDSRSSDNRPDGIRLDKTQDSLTGDAKAGRSIFFDSAVPYNCSVCHAVTGEGAAVGPDLAKSAARSPLELFSDIVMPGKVRNAGYQTVTVTLKSGDKLTGVKKEEDAESIRVYDATELPPVLRTIQKSDVASQETREQSVMPAD